MPVCSRSEDNLSISLDSRAWVIYVSTALRFCSVVNKGTSGFSGAKAKNVTPKIVSILVVKTEIFSCARPYSDISKLTLTPSLLPIQLVCIDLIRSGQSSTLEKSSNSSA